MVYMYLAELLVVMTDGLKIVRIYAWKCASRTRTQVLRRRRVSLQERDTVACSMHGGVVLLKHKKIVSDNLGMSGSGLWTRNLSWQYALFTFTPNLSKLVVINPVLGKNLKQPHLRR